LVLNYFFKGSRGRRVPRRAYTLARPPGVVVAEVCI
jgi:hypothetical protein